MHHGAALGLAFAGSLGSMFVAPARNAIAKPPPKERLRLVDRSTTVYDLRPALDATIIGVGVLAIAVPYSFSAQWIHPCCPCDPAEVNFVDRTAIGYHSATAGL